MNERISTITGNNQDNILQLARVNQPKLTTKVNDSGVKVPKSTADNGAVASAMNEPIDSHYYDRCHTKNPAPSKIRRGEE